VLVDDVNLGIYDKKNIKLIFRGLYHKKREKCREEDMYEVE